MRCQITRQKNKINIVVSNINSRRQSFHRYIEHLLGTYIEKNNFECVLTFTHMLAVKQQQQEDVFFQKA
jgi:predicted ATP-grasp superfamily ATP-dependent carboligase